ncbi:MAG: hypothetical protein E6J47_08550 [Chloroflexi bacterium]|nr:MAG: hypothetical protein E6J47_08550 [Chloroflexota bacterium]
MHRVEQFFGHLTARVDADELALAERILPASAWPLFVAMPVADRRHALDVAQRLMAARIDDSDLLCAALLHDAGKGRRLRLWHRVIGVLLEALAPRLLARLAGGDLSERNPYYLHMHHADLSAEAALRAGCSQRTAAFIRGRPSSADADLAAALHEADEAS